MFLLVLRLLAVYFATAAASLWLAHRFVSAVRLRVALFLALAPFLLVGKALVTAGVYAPIDIAYGGYPLESRRVEMGIVETRTPLLSDVVHSYIPSRKAVRDAIKNGRLPLWNRFSMVGEPLLAFQQPAALHPATWIGFSLPLAQAWTFEMAFRVLLALLCGYLFFRELGCGEFVSLLGAVGWAFCDHLVFFLGYSVAAALALFPLLLLGLRRLVREPGPVAVAVTVVSLILITLAGHPESLLDCVVGGGIYFLFELAGVGMRERWRALGLAVLAGVLSLGLTAVVLLPFAEIVPHTWAHVVRTSQYAASRKSADLRESLRLSVRNILPYVYGVSGRGLTAHGYGLPAGYAGSLLFPLALMGLTSRRREKWCFLILLFLGLSLWARLPGVADLVGKLPLLRISVNEYFVFLGAFGQIGLAVLGAERLQDSWHRRAYAVVALVCGGVVILGFLRFRPRLLQLQMSPAYLNHRLLLQILPLIIGAVWLWLRAWHADVRPVLAGLLLMAVAQRGLEVGEIYPTLPARTFYPELDLLRVIPRQTPDRSVAVGFTLIPDSSALYELEDVRGYEALVLSRLVETYPLWCVEQPVWFNRVDDPTRPFLSFLNVRHVLAGPNYAPPKGWKVLFRGKEGVLVENPRSLPRVFVPRSVFYEADADRRLELLRRIEDFSDRGVVGQAPPAGVWSGDAQPNGQASVRMASYLSDRITLETEVLASSVIATSVPAWPGWKLTVDGEKAGFLSYNHAFLGFRLPAGRHSVVMRYLPGSFVAGSAISAATLLLCVFFLFSWRRSGRMSTGRNRASPPPIGGNGARPRLAAD